MNVAAYISNDAVRDGIMTDTFWKNIKNDLDNYRMFILHLSLHHVSNESIDM